MMSRALDRPRDELQRLRDERARRKAANQAMLPGPAAVVGKNEQLAAKAKAGDRQALSDLWEANVGILAQVFRNRWKLRPQEIEDAIQDAYEPFSKAVATFDPATGFRFVSWLTRLVDQNQIKRVRKERGTKEKPRPRMLTGGLPEDDAPRAEPTVQPDELPSELAERQKIARKALESVKTKYRDILLDLFGFNGPPVPEVEIARQTGMSKQRINAIKKRGLEIMREAVGDTEVYRQAQRNASPERYRQAHWDTPEFKEWFGDSNVRHPETGEPLVVYHGTETPDIAAFDPARRGSNTGSPDAFHGFSFTDRAGDADTWAKLHAWRPDRPNAPTSGVLPVYLRMKNPFHSETAATPEIITQAKKSGHDGIIVTWNDGSREYTVFDPGQIKSATGNRGTYSKDDQRINYRQAFADAFVERYGLMGSVANAVLKWAAPQPPEPSEAVKQRAQAIGQQMRQPKPQPLPERHVDEHNLTFPSIPAIREAKSTLDALHNTTELQKRADPVAFKLADQQTRARRDSEAWQNAYEQHIGKVRNDIHQQLSAKVPDLLKSARAEHDRQHQDIQRVGKLARNIENQMLDMEPGSPEHQYAKGRLARMKQAMRAHYQFLNTTMQDLEARGAPDAIPAPEQWVNPRVKRRQDHQDILDHRRRVKELERAGHDVTGPTGDRIADERDPRFREAIKARHLELQREPKSVKAAKPASQPQQASPADALQHARWAVEATETPEAMDREISKRYKQAVATRLDARTRRSNDPWARIAKHDIRIRIRDQVRAEAKQTAQQAIQHARDLHAQHGHDDGGQLDALEARLTGRQQQPATPVASDASQSPRQEQTTPTARPQEQSPASTTPPVSPTQSSASRPPTEAELRKQDRAAASRESKKNRKAFAEGRRQVRLERENIAKAKTAQAAQQAGMTPEEYLRVADQLTTSDPVLSEQWSKAVSLNNAREDAKRRLGNAYYKWQRQKRGLPQDGKDHPFTDAQAENLDEILKDRSHPAWIDGLAESLDSSHGLGWGGDESSFDGGFGGHHDYKSTSRYSDHANERLWDLLTTTPDHGPHQDKWHEDVLDAIERNKIQSSAGQPKDSGRHPQDSQSPEQQAADENVRNEFASQGEQDKIVAPAARPRRELPKAINMEEEISKRVEAARLIKKAEEDRKRREAAGEVDEEAAPFTARHSLRRDLYSALAGLTGAA